MPEVRADQRLQGEAHRLLRELHIYTPTRPARMGSVAVAEPPFPDDPETNDTVARLERCIGLQARAIEILKGEPPRTRDSGFSLCSEPVAAEIQSLLEEAMRHERAAVHACREQREELEALRSEMNALVVALRQTETLSLTDELTGLPNRRAFMQRLDEELSRSQRHGQPLALALLDIDHFKRINDRHGHHAGDNILRGYARSMLRDLRQHDLLARYGGEEFALLLPETSLDDARNVLEKLADRLRREPLDLGSQSVQLPSFSAGVVSLRAGESAAMLIDRADYSLYRAKHLGRNRIETDG